MGFSVWALFLVVVVIFIIYMSFNMAMWVLFVIAVVFLAALLVFCACYVVKSVAKSEAWQRKSAKLADQSFSVMENIRDGAVKVYQVTTTKAAQWWREYVADHPGEDEKQQTEDGRTDGDDNGDNCDNNKKTQEEGRPRATAGERRAASRSKKLRRKKVKRAAQPVEHEDSAPFSAAESEPGMAAAA